MFTSIPIELWFITFTYVKTVLLKLAIALELRFSLADLIHNDIDEMTRQYREVIAINQSKLDKQDEEIRQRHFETHGTHLQNVTYANMTPVEITNYNRLYQKIRLTKLEIVCYIEEWKNALGYSDLSDARERIRGLEYLCKNHNVTFNLYNYASNQKNEKQSLLLQPIMIHYMYENTPAD
jgi:hypothetical protein